MSKFKVGDKVRRIKGGHHGMKPGDVGIISEIHSFSEDLYIKEFPGLGPHDARNFELVSPSEDTYNIYVKFTKPESELERLVRVANEGLDALATLHKKHRRTFDFGGLNRRYGDYDTADIAVGITDGDKWKVRVKPKPAFEPFTVGSNWLVKLEGDTLHIGCQAFDAKALKKGLTSIKKSSVFNFFGGNEQLHAYRDGVGRTDRSGAEISWSDADKILAALEKAGIK